MKISLLICTYNRAPYLYKTLESVVGLHFGNLDYEIIIIDNKSTDNTKSVCEYFSKRNSRLNISYFFESKQGLSNARNRGIEVSKGDVITFIDDDVLLNMNFLQEVKKYFEKHDDFDIIGGKVLLKYEGEKPKWITAELEQYLSKIDYGNEELRIDFLNKWLVGANISFRKRVFEKELFNVNLGRMGTKLISGEEIELCLKIIETGGKALYAPSITLLHLIPKSRTTRLYLFNRVYYGGVSMAVSEFKEFEVGLLYRLSKPIIKNSLLIICFPLAKDVVNRLTTIVHYLGKIKGLISIKPSL